MEPLKDFEMNQELYDRLTLIEIPDLYVSVLLGNKEAEKRLKELYDRYSNFLPENTFEVDEKGNLIF